MRVLIYTDSPIFSGAETVICDVAGALSQCSTTTVSCAAPHSNEHLIDRLSAATGTVPLDVPAQPLPAAAFQLYDPRRRRAVARALAGGDWDAMLVNLPSPELGATPLLIEPSLRPRALGLLHIAGSFKELGFRLGGARQRLAARAMRRLDAVCVLSGSARETYARVWGGDLASTHVVRLPRPSVESSPRQAARASLGLPEAPLIGIVGRISFKQKGQDTFAEAASLLLARMPALHFAVAGEGQDRERLERLVAELGLGRRFHFLGQVSGVGRFLSALDALAIPSLFEGLPLVALEALAVGIPGVASDIDGLRDIWPSAWRAPIGDPSALAAKLEEVLTISPAERDRLIAEGRKAAQERTTEDVAAEFEPLLRELAS